jgi:glycine cleavage system H protein
MKEIDNLIFDTNVQYSREHTWARAEGGQVVVGISDYAQNQLGEIIFVDLPQPGSRFAVDEAFGVVESIKTASDLYIPVAGTISSVNEALASAPELINQSPYKQGWIIRVNAQDLSDLKMLLDAQEYRNNLL